MSPQEEKGKAKKQPLTNERQLYNNQEKHQNRYEVNRTEQSREMQNKSLTKRKVARPMIRAATHNRVCFYNKI